MTTKLKRTTWKEGGQQQQNQKVRRTLHEWMMQWMNYRHWKNPKRTTSLSIKRAINPAGHYVAAYQSDNGRR